MTISSRRAPGCVCRSGDVIDMVNGTVTRLARPPIPPPRWDTLVADLIGDCIGNADPVTAPGVTREAHVSMLYRSHEDGTGYLDIESIRDRHG